MSKRLLCALALIALSAVVLIMNAGESMDLVFFPRVVWHSANQAIALLATMAVGVAIGILLR